MNAKQYAWIYMIDQGLANKRPSYYGGYDIEDTDDLGGVTKKQMFGTALEWESGYINRIRTIGVNWGATQSPNGRSYSSFEGTFCDPGSKEYLTGTLVLNDGSKQKWIAEPLVMNAFEMMANIEQLQSKYQDLFGEEV